MKKVGLLVAIVFSGMLAQAQEQTSITYKRDTIWLKTGMVMPCEIIEDLTNTEYVYVNIMTGLDKIEQTRFF